MDYESTRSGVLMPTQKLSRVTRRDARTSEGSTSVAWSGNRQYITHSQDIPETNPDLQGQRKFYTFVTQTRRVPIRVTKV